MDNEYEKRNTQATSGGFSLIPWAALFRAGEMIEWPDSSLAVLPIIAAHANKKGEAWPGYELICALASVSKTTVAAALDSLIANEWIEKTYDQYGKYSHNKYRLLYGEHDTDSRDNMAIHHQLIFSGTWGAMRPSERRVYLIFRSFGWTGLSAVQFGYEIAGYDKEEIYDDVPSIVVPVRGKLKEFDYRDVQVLPAHLYDPAEFAELAAVNPRTFREAKAWLIDHGLICPYVDDGGIEEKGVTRGFILPFKSGIRFRSILDAVEKAKKESAVRSKGTPGGKRSFGAMLRRSAVKNTA